MTHQASALDFWVTKLSPSLELRFEVSMELFGKLFLYLQSTGRPKFTSHADLLG